MTDPLLFTLAVLVLLATPGPTNTLLATSGAAVGIRRSLALIPAELCGYLASIGLIMALAGPMVAAHATVGTALKLAAALWLACCAGRLWRQGGAEALHPRIGRRQVLVTTLLNPKGLIFALAIFPQGSPAEVAPWLAGFSALVAMVAMGWVAMGAGMARVAGDWAAPGRIRRATSAVLVVFAVLLAGSALAG